MAEPFEVSEARIKYGDSKWEGFPKPMFTLSLEEARVLYELLAHQYIDYENAEAHTIIRSLQLFVDRFTKHDIST